MITFKPVNDEKSLKTLFNADSSFVGYVAIQDGKPLGSCLFKLDEAYMNIVRINYSKGGVNIAEGLIRAALNFAAKRNAYIARINPGVGDSLATNLGFVFKDGQFEAEIPEILLKECAAV